MRTVIVLCTTASVNQLTELSLFRIETMFGFVIALLVGVVLDGFEFCYWHDMTYKGEK